MSDEIRVSIQPDQGIKNQWGRGFFYRNDGKKRTLIPKNMILAVGAVFGVAVIQLLVQDGSDRITSASKAAVNAMLPADDESKKVDNIPSAATASADVKRNASSEDRGRAGRKKSAELKFAGPQVVNRPGLGKIPPGSMVKAVLLSGASNGPVRAQVTEGLSVNGETLIDEGTILVGQGQSGEDRLNIRFNQMVFRDGAFSSINAQACDADDKIPGLKGSKIGNQALKLGMGIGLNFAGGLSDALQDTEGQNGVMIRRPTLRNAMLNGAATAALDQSREIMSETKSRAPVIEVPSGTAICVLFFQGN